MYDLNYQQIEARDSNIDKGNDVFNNKTINTFNIYFLNENMSLNEYLAMGY